MTARESLGHFISLIAVALVCVGAPGARAAEETVGAPEWKLGDWWEFENDGRTWRLTVIGRDKDRYVLTRTPKGQTASPNSQLRLYAGIDGWVTREIDPKGVTKELDWVEWVRFPLRVDKNWVFRTDTRTVSGGRDAFTFHCKVTGWDTLEIGGRPLRTLKIVCSHSSLPNNPVNYHDVWYAPEAKHIVRLAPRYRGGWAYVVTGWNVQASDTTIAAAPPATPGVTSPPATSKPAAPSPPASAQAPAVAPPANVPTVPAADTEPPKIAINYPPAEAKVDREQITVLGLVTDNVGLERVLVSVNGVVLTPGGERVDGKSHSIRTPVPLQPGENVIEVTAIDRAGNAVQAIRTVTRAGPALATPPPSVGNRWAVIIGVGRYENPQIPPLRYTVADAEAMYRTLTGAAGFKKDNVLLLTDRSDRKPTLKNIKYALGTFLARNARKDDTVLIFFAGHGAPEIDQRGLERDGLAKYLIPMDADPEDLYSTALPMDELQTIFGRLESDRVVAFLDACYSGAAGGRTFASKKTRAGGVDDQFLDRLTRSRGRAIITASRPAEVSIELPELGHGLFTYYTVAGLKGAADGNRDGIVTLQELYEYVEAEVSKKSRAVGGNQHPVMKGELEGVLPLTRVGR